eukprot:5741301-Pyramimonas_sp.AAC.2
MSLLGGLPARLHIIQCLAEVIGVCAHSPGQPRQLVLIPVQDRAPGERPSWAMPRSGAACGSTRSAAGLPSHGPSGRGIADQRWTDTDP